VKQSPQERYPTILKTIYITWVLEWDLFCAREMGKRMLVNKQAGTGGVEHI